MHLSQRALIASAFLLLDPVRACSRVTYNAQVDDRFAIGRSMDFVTSTNSSIFIFPAGLNRSGSVADNSLTWTSNYGSMVATMYDKVSIDGMNTEGLTGSLLYLGVSDYGARNTSRPGLAIGFWLQYFLDQYSTVADAVADLGKIDMQVVTAAMVPGVSSTGHLSLSDKSGDNAVIEYVDGRLVVHHGTQYQVMTNDPTFEEQLALNAYWEPIANFSLPGTSSPADRFVRLSYYNRLSPKSPDMLSAITTAAAMIRAVSVPFVPPDQINTGVDVWPTLWRVYYDTIDMVFFYESAVTPVQVFMRFEDFNMTKGAEVMSLPLLESEWESLQGDTDGKFTKAATFEPIGGNA